MSNISKVTDSNYVTTSDIQGNDVLHLVGDYFTDFKDYNDTMAHKYSSMSAEEAREYVVGVLAAKGPKSIGGDGSLNLTEEQYYDMLTVWDNDDNYGDNDNSKLGSSEIIAMAYMLIEANNVSTVQPHNATLAITSMFNSYDSFSNSENHSNVLVWANQLAAFNNPKYDIEHDIINRVFNQGKDGTFDFTAMELVDMYESYAPYATNSSSSDNMSKLLYNSRNDDNTINYKELFLNSIGASNVSNYSGVNFDTYFGGLDFDNLSEEQKASIISFAFVASSYSYGSYEPNWDELALAINNGDMDYVNNTLLPSTGVYSAGFHVTDEYIRSQSQFRVSFVELNEHDPQYDIMHKFYGVSAYTFEQYKRMNSELSDDSYFKLTPDEIASISEEFRTLDGDVIDYNKALNKIIDAKCESMAADIARLMYENIDRVNHGELMDVLSEAGYSETELRAFMEHENEKHRGEEGYVPYSIWGSVSNQEEYDSMGAEGGKMFAAYISGSVFMDAFSNNNEIVNNFNIDPEHSKNSIEDPDNEDIVRDDDSEVRPDTDTHVVEKGDINASNVDVMIQNILYPVAGESEEATKYIEEIILTEENLGIMNDSLDIIFYTNSEDLKGRNNLTEDDIKMLTILYNQDPQIVDDAYLEDYIFASDVERKNMLADKVTDWVNNPEATGKNVLTANMIMESLSGSKREVLDILKLESVDVAFGNSDDIHVNTFFNKGLTGETLLMVDQILTSQYESGKITEDQYMDKCEELEDKAYHMAAMANDIVEQTVGLEFLMDDYVEDHGQTHEEALKAYIEQYAADHPDEDVMSWEELEDRMNNPEKYLYELDENGEPVVTNKNMYRWNFANGELPPDTPDDIRDAYRIYMLDKAVGDGEGGVDSEKQSEMGSLLRTALTAGIAAFRGILEDSPLGQKILMMANEWVHRPPVNGTLFQEIWDLDEESNNYTFRKEVPGPNYDPGEPVPKYGPGEQEPEEQEPEEQEPEEQEPEEQETEEQETEEQETEEQETEEPVPGEPVPGEPVPNYGPGEQEPEEQEPEEQEPEEQEPEEQESEEQESEEQEPEEQEPEEQEPEEQEPEEQEPEEVDFEEREFEEIDPEGPGMDEAYSEEQDPEEQDPEEQDPEEADFEEQESEVSHTTGGTGASSDEYSGKYVGTDSNDDDFSKLYEVLDDVADEYTEASPEEASPEDAITYSNPTDSTLMGSNLESTEMEPEESYSEEQNLEEHEEGSVLETLIAPVENEAETPAVTESEFEERDFEEASPEYNDIELTDDDLSQEF